MEFYKDPECTERLTELQFEESYVEDIYGSSLENTVQVGDSVSKIIYLYNNELVPVAIRSISSESPFLSFAVENAQLKSGEVTPLHVTFKPTVEVLKELEEMSDPTEKAERKRQLLQGKLKVESYRVYRPSL